MKTIENVLEEFNSYLGKELDQYDIGAIMVDFEDSLSEDVIISQGYDGDEAHVLVYKDHPDATQINLVYEKNNDSEQILLKVY